MSVTYYYFEKAPNVKNVCGLRSSLVNSNSLLGPAIAEAMLLILSLGTYLLYEDKVK